MVIGGAWLKEKDGKKYYSCQITIPFFGALNFAIFKNEKKEKENQPDYQIVWSLPKKSSDTRSGNDSSNSDSPFNDNDIPF